MFVCFFLSLVCECLCVCVCVYVCMCGCCFQRVSAFVHACVRVVTVLPGICCSPCSN